MLGSVVYFLLEQLSAAWSCTTALKASQCKHSASSRSIPRHQCSSPATRVHETSCVHICRLQGPTLSASLRSSRTALSISSYSTLSRCLSEQSHYSNATESFSSRVSAHCYHMLMFSTHSTMGMGSQQGHVCTLYAQKRLNSQQILCMAAKHAHMLLLQLQILLQMLLQLQKSSYAC